MRNVWPECWTAWFYLRPLSSLGLAAQNLACRFLSSFFFEMESHSVTRLECSGRITVHCNLCLSGSSNYCASAFWVPKIRGAPHHTGLIFVFLVKTGFYHIGQACLKLLTLGDLPASASQSAGIIVVSHHNCLDLLYFLPHLFFMLYSLFLFVCIKLINSIIISSMV